MSVLRILRRSFGISAPRMAVRPEVPWHWRSLRLGAWIALALAAGWLLINTIGGRAFSYGHLDSELARLQETAETQEKELTDLRARAAQMERQLQMERAAAADLAKQVKALTFDNAKLKEDLAFFQSVMSPPGARDGAISVSRFRLQPEATAGEYRYQMVLVQSGQRTKEFKGRLQFVIDVQHQGRKVAMTVPNDKEIDAKDYQLNFKFFQRIEGTFKLSPGSVLQGIQVRVFENGSRAPKLTQNLNVS
jgi:hypothetical protein